MKKNIIIVVLSLVSISAGSFGYYQFTRAEEFRLQALESAVRAKEAEAEALKQRDMAEIQRAVAQEQAMIAASLAEKSKK